MRSFPQLALAALFIAQTCFGCRIVCSKKGSSVIHCYDTEPDSYRLILYPAEEREVIIGHLSCTLTDENRLLIDCKGDSPAGKTSVKSTLRSERRVVPAEKGSRIEETKVLEFDVMAPTKANPTPKRQLFQFDMNKDECGSAAEG